MAARINVDLKEQIDSETGVFKDYGFVEDYPHRFIFETTEVEDDEDVVVVEINSLLARPLVPPNGSRGLVLSFSRVNTLKHRTYIL